MHFRCTSRTCAACSGGRRSQPRRAATRLRSIRERLTPCGSSASSRAAERSWDALEAYQRAREELLEQLGLEPSSELRELQAAILRQEPSLEVEPAELRARRHLPTPATAFVGRNQELASVLERFREDGARLVTL